jgi:hypothetical protein
MSKNNFFTKPFSWSVTLGVFCCVISSLLFLFTNQDTVFYAILPAITNLLFISGLLLILLGIGVKYELSQLSQQLKETVTSTHKQFYDKFELSNLAKECEKIGLVKIEDDSSNHRYDEILVNPKNLVVVLNDGRTWTSQHRDRLRRRFEDPSKETTIFLCHKDSNMIPVLARKGSVDINTIQNRILETVHMLEQLKTSDTTLEILGHHLFNPFSLVLSDEEALFTPYFLSRGGRTRPMFHFHETENPNFYKDLEKDIEMLRKDAEDISLSKTENSLNKVINFQTR